MEGAQVGRFLHHESCLEHVSCPRISVAAAGCESHRGNQVSISVIVGRSEEAVSPGPRRQQCYVLNVNVCLVKSDVCLPSKGILSVGNGKDCCERRADP